MRHGFKPPPPYPPVVPHVAVLDANALLLPFQFRLNLELELRRLLGECRIVVPEPVLGELDVNLASDRWAKAARQLASKFPSEPAQTRGDDAVIEVAQRLGGVVVTNDAAMIDRLRDLRIPRIFLRSRNHLTAEGLD